MNALVQVTVDQLKDLLTEAELSQLPEMTMPGADDAESWLADILMRACDRVAGAVNACNRNEHIPTGLCKVPAECVHTALVLARHAAISALPGMGDTLEGSSRAAEYATACSELTLLATGRMAVDYALNREEEVEDSFTGSFRAISKPGKNFLF